jgi:hypothetical protein
VVLSLHALKLEAGEYLTDRSPSSPGSSSV